VNGPPLKIAMIGAAGRMGRRIVAGLDREMKLCGAIEYAECPDLGKDAGVLAGVGPLNVALTSDLEAGLQNAQVAIDFSTAEAAGDHARACAGKGTPLVVGITGLGQEAETALRAAAEVIPVVWASNTSVGMNLLFRLVRQAVAAMGEDCDIEIVEAHHRLKKDAPSGSALSLARAAAEARKTELERWATYGRQGLVGERPRGEIGIHAVRGGDIVGDHTVILAHAGERLELTHRAHSRDTFARGALRAARFASEAAPGLYSMEDVLFA